ncbi:sorting nexin-20 [Plodia interpunctella]|uniref:sorting nexin-20 n=1 Tax=Plodia interpunctella TaxID=58824 RepID=UPI0023675341|nr:sorting nexin-20 [Plodia interpunctella]
MLKFEIVSSRTVEGDEKKFVAYMMQASRNNKGANEMYDADPANVERRYTHFLELYNGLKKEYPALLGSISFPRKMMVGNFDPELISTRCAAFESLLELIASESRLRESPVTIMFFQDSELKEAKRLIQEEKFEKALSILETSFKLLNKVYTDRSRAVLCALCRLVACAGASGGALAGPAERWAQLALRRYEAVSDSDLLLIYVPLLHTCISIWETLGRDKSKLVEELNALRKKGMKVDSVASLMDAVDELNITV